MQHRSEHRPAPRSVHDAGKAGKLPRLARPVKRTARGNLGEFGLMPSDSTYCDLCIAICRALPPPCQAACGNLCGPLCQQ